MPRPKKQVREETPAIGHNSQDTDDQLIAENHKLEDELKAGMAKYAEWAKPRKERIEAIESEIRRRLIERNADSTRTDSGTAYFSDLLQTKIEDREALFDFIADNWESYGDQMLKLGAAVDAVRQYMSDHDGNPPPGLSVSFYRRLNIRRS